MKKEPLPRYTAYEYVTVHGFDIKPKLVSRIATVVSMERGIEIVKTPYGRLYPEGVILRAIELVGEISPPEFEDGTEDRLLSRD